MFLEQQGDDPLTAALDSLADEFTAQTAPNTGRALIDGGGWEW